MSAKSVIAAIVFILLTFNYLSNVKAQDTFGPICDDVTVTCIPTQSPTPGAATPSPTITKTPTPVPPTPTELPRAGTTENVRNIILLALSFVFTGSLGHLILSPKKS